jgi:hypothetical protein
MKTSRKALASPVSGTWKLNPTKSTFSAGPRPKELLVRLEASGEGENATANGVNAGGQRHSIQYTANYDGHDYPIIGSVTADTISLKRIDPRTTQRIDKKDGKVVETRTRKVSRDGKTFTVTFKGTYPDGQLISHVLVFERQ